MVSSLAHARKLSQSQCSAPHTKLWLAKLSGAFQRGNRMVPTLKTPDQPQYELSQNSFFHFFPLLLFINLKTIYKLALKKHQLIFSTDVVRIRFLHFRLFGWYSQYITCINIWTGGVSNWTLMNLPTCFVSRKQERKTVKNSKF